MGPRADRGGGADSAGAGSGGSGGGERAEPADERPEYPREDIARHLDGDGEFRGLVAEVERKLGKKLTTRTWGFSWA